MSTLKFLRQMVLTSKTTSIGRFITEDPVGFDGGINFYSFAENDLINSKDPFGLIKCKPGPNGCDLDNLCQETLILAQCLEDCLKTVLQKPCFELTITSTTEGTHKKRSAHYKGIAFDIGFASNPSLKKRREDVEYCYKACFDWGNSFAQQEKTHYHFQNRKGKKGACGFKPGVAK